MAMRTADVVIVGAGAAGCVLARRLSDAGRSVVMLEAGPDLRRDSAPDLVDGWRLPKTHDWGFESEPDRNGHQAPLRRVRGIGGTSWMTRFAMRGHASDFDAWARAGGDAWGFDAVLPAFRSLERDLDFGASAWHGDRGPLPITRYADKPLADIHAAAVEAARRQGFAWVEDANAPDAIGIGRVPMSSHDGQRVTTAHGYLGDPVSGGLVIRPDAAVATLIFEGRRVTGARLVDGEVIGGDEVIVSAGTYGSPALLLRSGIGPADDLRALGIESVADLPGVGDRLADHPAVDAASGWEGSAPVTPTLHTFATLRSEGSAATDPPDLGFWLTDPSGDPPSFEISVVLLKPRSRGRVTLRSADPSDPPRIKLPDLDDASDVRRLAEGLRLAAAILEDQEVASRGGRPAASLRSADRDLHRQVMADAYSIPHVVGTCAMGRDPSGGAVVDPDGRVHGVDGLRVVDASIMPDAPAGFPHIVTIMLAETIAARMTTQP